MVRKRLRLWAMPHSGRTSFRVCLNPGFAVSSRLSLRVATGHTTFYPPSFSLDLILHALGYLNATAPSTIVGCSATRLGHGQVYLA